MRETPRAPATTTPKKQRKKKRAPPSDAPSQRAPSSPTANGPAGVSWKQWAIGSAWLLCAGIFWKVCLAAAPATSPSASSTAQAPEATVTGDPAPIVPPSLAIIESDCRDAAIAKLPAGATMPQGLSIGSLTSGLPERGPTSARWSSVYTKANGAPSTWSCSYDYASKAAAITLE